MLAMYSRWLPHDMHVLATLTASGSGTNVDIFNALLLHYCSSKLSMQYIDIP